MDRSLPRDAEKAQELGGGFDAHRVALLSSGPVMQAPVRKKPVERVQRARLQRQAEDVEFGRGFEERLIQP